MSVTSEQTSNVPWWTSAVVYQVYPRSFADSDGDGIGDLPGLISKLDYLQDLGVDVVWVSPFYRSPMDDNGYDISDYRDVDPIFGTLADLDELIAQLHGRDMKLMIDVVVNHTSDEHPWFLESRSSTDSAKRDWYWWQPPRPGTAAGEPGAEPTNWIAAFQGSVWELDASGEYYLHLFSRRQPDLNWENPEVREAVYEMLRWWLARGVDGFRMDVINYISKALPLHDGPPLPSGPYGDGSQSYQSGPRIHEFLHELHTEVIVGDSRQSSTLGDSRQSSTLGDSRQSSTVGDSRQSSTVGDSRQLITVGEMPGVTITDAQQFTDPARAEVDMVFQFEHVGLDHGPGGRYDLRPLLLTDLKTSLGRWQDGLADSGWNSLYWNNHDQPRAVSRFGSDDPVHREHSAKLLGTVLHLHRGTPYIYQGEELGMTNCPFTSIDDFRDIDSLNYFAQASAAGVDLVQVLTALRRQSRDNARTPMQWDDSTHAGFTTGTPWIDVNPNHDTINAAAQTSDPASVFSHYRRLVALRHQLPVVAHGDFTMLLPDDEQVYAFLRRLDTTELLVIANFSDQLREVTLPGAADWARAELVLSNYGDDTDGFVLRAWEARVYLRTD